MILSNLCWYCHNTSKIEIIEILLIFYTFTRIFRFEKRANQDPYFCTYALEFLWGDDFHVLCWSNKQYKSLRIFSDHFYIDQIRIRLLQTNSKCDSLSLISTYFTRIQLVVFIILYQSQLWETQRGKTLSNYWASCLSDTSF